MASPSASQLAHDSAPLAPGASARLQPAPTPIAAVAVQLAPPATHTSADIGAANPTDLPQPALAQPSFAMPDFYAPLFVKGNEWTYDYTYLDTVPGK